MPMAPDPLLPKSDERYSIWLWGLGYFFYPLAELDPAIHVFAPIKMWTRGSSPREGYFGAFELDRIPL
jgi:hypothetical protein